MEEMKDKKLQQIAEKALTDSVVRVVWQKTDEESGEDLIWARASGFFIDTNLVVTNIHCIVDAPSAFVELVSRKTEFPIEGVVAFDVENDLVVLAVTGEGVPLSLGNSDTVQIGDNVCAVGYPRAEKGEATQVTIQGIRKSGVRRFQIKEAFDPGNSGSALLNSLGEVIGVVVGAAIEISVFSGGFRPYLSHAIPANILNTMLASIGKTETLVKWQTDPLVQSYAKGREGQAQMMQQKHEAALFSGDIHQSCRCKDFNG